MRTANPVLSDRAMSDVTVAPGSGVLTSGVMTLEGTVNKTLISVAITSLAATWTWLNPGMGSYAMLFAIAGLVLGLIVPFKKEWAPALTPAYAVVEGCFLGSISLWAETIYPGVVFQAVSLTFGTLFCLLVAYKSRWIAPSENFKLGLVAATGAIFVVYLITFILGLCGVNVSFMTNSGPLSIGISLVVVVIAALNLVLDFDFIEHGAASGRMPKYMEWYGAFGLLVTLIWLYLEILRLLMKLNSRD